MLIQVFVTVVDGVTERVVSASDMKGVMVGCVYLAIGKRSAWLRRMFVAEHARKAGVGSALLERCRKEAIEAGMKSIGITLDEKNIETAPFYEKNGFVGGYEYDDNSFMMWQRLPEAEKLDDDKISSRVQLTKADEERTN